MSNYGSNKVATAVLLDVSRGMDQLTQDGRTHFERSKHILKRIILRKMFAYETDEMGIVTFGPEGVKTASDLKIPTWETYDRVEQLSLASASAAGNWAQGLIRAVDFLQQQCQGKRFKTRQVVVFSNFTWSSPSVHSKLEPLVHVVNGDNVQVIVIGLNIEKESQSLEEAPAGVGELTEFVTKLNSGMVLSFEEIEDEVKDYVKKKKAKRLTKGVMKIGAEISLNFRWMKVTTDEVRLKFQVPPRKLLSSSTGLEASVSNGTKRPDLLVDGGPLKKLRADTSVAAPDDDETVRGDATAKYTDFELKFAQDESRKTRFGATEVLLTYADIEALKLKTGPPSMTFLGTVKSSRITRAMIVSPEVYMIVADVTKRSKAQLSALITSLLKANKYGLARRIASVNGRPKIGILYPVSDEWGKALYFLQLPLADWVNAVPFRPVPDIVEPELDGLMDQLIDAMSIDGRGKELLPKDPNFQLKNFQIELKATENQECNRLPELVEDIFHPHPDKEAAGDEVLKRILSAFEIPPPPPESDETPSEATKTPKKELTEAEKKEIAAIEKMAFEDTDNADAEWGKYYVKRFAKESEKPTTDTEEIMKMISPL